MTVAPCEIAVIQRGIKFSVDFVPSPHSHPDPTQREYVHVCTYIYFPFACFKI